MTDDVDARPRHGAAGIWVLFCAAGGGAGLAFDLALNTGRGFWAGDEPGAHAAIGAVVSLFVIGAGYLARVALVQRKDDSKQSGESNAGDLS